MHIVGRTTYVVLKTSVRRYSIAASTQPVAAQIREHAKARISQIEAGRGVAPAFIDTYNREHNYLRISLTERCNLRCFYCMPAEGIELSPKSHIMTDDEIIRLATLFVKSGVTKIRLTGGEPTIRKGLLDIVRRLNELKHFGLRSIGMTSNGLVLHRNLAQFVENGLTHLNLSLDTLDPFKFELMTRRMGHEAVMKTLKAALSSNLQSVKLNVVVIKGLNDSEVPQFVEMTKDQNLSVRFIEFMPFTGNKWDKAKMLPSSVILSRLQQIHPAVTKVVDEVNDTARSYRIPGYKGSFGFISSMSDHFCSTCNRMRLTADGQIKVCLFDAKEISLRDQMRQGASDEDLLQTVSLAIHGKKAKHAGMEDIDVVTNRPMILIGVHNQPRPRRRPMPNLYMLAGSNLGYTATPSIRCMSTKSSSLLPRLTHFNQETGRSQMVDVGAKSDTLRTAKARGRIYIPEVAHKLITSDDSAPDPEESPDLINAKTKARRKGDVLAVAQLAGIMGCKRTPDLIPLCHPLPLNHVEVVLTPEVKNGSYSILCTATASCDGKTGVEMEALTGVSVALLTVWDMLKAVAGKEMKIGEIIVESKSGGKSGDFYRQPEDD